MILRARAPTFAKYVSYAIGLPRAHCLASAWICCPWACRTISKSPSKRVRRVCAWARQFSGKDGNNNRRTQRTPRRFSVSVLQTFLFVLKTATQVYGEFHLCVLVVLLFIRIGRALV